MSEEILEPPDITSSPQETFSKPRQTKKGLNVSKTQKEKGNPPKRKKDRVKKNSKESDAIRSGTGSGSGPGSASGSGKKGEDKGSGIKSKTASEKSPSYADADAESEDSETSSQFYLRESQTDVLEGTIIVTESASIVNVDVKSEPEPSPNIFNPCCCRRKSTRFLRDSCYVMGAVESSVAISIICIFSVFTMTGHQGKIIKFEELNQDFADALTFLIWLATAFTGIFQVSAASCKLMYMCTLNLVLNGIIILLVLGYIVTLALYALYPAIPLSLYSIFFILKIYMSLCTFGLLEQYRVKADSLAKGNKVSGNVTETNDKDSRIFAYENDNQTRQNIIATKKVLLWKEKIKR